jgi:hypothetical protein
VIVFILLLSLIALVVALRRPNVIAETYTQYLRRSGDNEIVSDKNSNKLSFETEKKGSRGPFLLGKDTDPHNSQDLSINLYAYSSKKILIGRDPDINHIKFINGSVSSQHASIFKKANHYFIEDRGSSNGTRVNNILIDSFHSIQLKNGDIIQLGELLFVYQETN